MVVDVSVQTKYPTRHWDKTACNHTLRCGAEWLGAYVRLGWRVVCCDVALQSLCFLLSPRH
eukprot:10340078-Lingulodinium_polyedra.AAC.1